jgi:hypothetical protein
MVSVFKIGEPSPDVHSLFFWPFWIRYLQLVYIAGTMCGPVLGASSFAKMLTWFFEEYLVSHFVVTTYPGGILLIPQVRPAHKYPNSPWEMIHPPGGDNAVCM